jgi:hypothetical protein
MDTCQKLGCPACWSARNAGLLASCAKGSKQSDHALRLRSMPMVCRISRRKRANRRASECSCLGGRQRYSSSVLRGAFIAFSWLDVSSVVNVTKKFVPAPSNARPLAQLAALALVISVRRLRHRWHGSQRTCDLRHPTISIRQPNAFRQILCLDT